ncbi:unnamed protein product [Paramecium pentaurelia]|uniref:Uncharacterized protein n=1 Tax=Paramecium pentaurelia TaxID=43138 RepID=A0A8S1YIH2_9CILI|nr:unnamed protein product [Paramecium pentaurelia]
MMEMKVLQIQMLHEQLIQVEDLNMEILFCNQSIATSCGYTLTSTDDTQNQNYYNQISTKSGDLQRYTTALQVHVQLEQSKGEFLKQYLMQKLQQNNFIQIKLSVLIFQCSSYTIRTGAKEKLIQCNEMFIIAVTPTKCSFDADALVKSSFTCQHFIKYLFLNLIDDCYSLGCPKPQLLVEDIWQQLQDIIDHTTKRIFIILLYIAKQLYYFIFKTYVNSINYIPLKNYQLSTQIVNNCHIIGKQKKIVIIIMKLHKSLQLESDLGYWMIVEIDK